MSANKTHLLLSGLFIFIVGNLINLFVKTIPLTFAHAVYFCQKSFTNAIAFPHTTPFLLLLFLTFIFIIGSIIFVIQVMQTRRFIKNRVKRSMIAPKKLQSSSRLMSFKNKIDVIDDTSHLSFCYGLLRPRICLSTGLIQKLTKNELKAVLIHEEYHLKNYDPLRIILGKTASRMLFFIPTLRDIQRQYTFSKELAADAIVIKNGQKQSLISALMKTLSTSGLSGVAAFSSSDDLEKRIVHLTNQKTYISITLSKRNLLFSLTSLSLLFVMLSTPVHAVAMNTKSMDMMDTIYICPFGDSCLAACKQYVKVEHNPFVNRNDINASKNILYTPVK